MIQIELQEVFALIAELAIAFAGFTGITAVLGNIATNGLLRMRIAAIMVCAFGTMLLSLLPTVLALLRVEEVAIWFWCNLALVLFFLGPLCLWPWVNRLRSSQRDVFRLWAVVLAYLSPSLGSLCGVLGIVLQEQAVGWFVTGLVMYLVSCIFMFVRAVFTARYQGEPS